MSKEISQVDIFIFSINAHIRASSKLTGKLQYNLTRPLIRKYNTVIKNTTNKEFIIGGNFVAAFGENCNQIYRS